MGTLDNSCLDFQTFIRFQNLISPWRSVCLEFPEAFINGCLYSSCNYISFSALWWNNGVKENENNLPQNDSFREVQLLKWLLRIEDWKNVRNTTGPSGALTDSPLSDNSSLVVYFKMWHPPQMTKACIFSLWISCIFSCKDSRIWYP